MSYNFNLPSIQGSTVEQLSQIRSYLYQIIPQLQWAINNLDASTVSSSTAQQVHQAKVAAATGSSSVSPQATFNAIKSLIITSADIVQAYYDEIEKRLSGLYVAESDFGTYVEATNAIISANSSGISQAYTNIQAVESTLYTKIDIDIENAKSELSEGIGKVEGRVSETEQGLKDAADYIIETKASIRTGILYYLGSDGKEYDDKTQGAAVYGVEVGQVDKVNDVEVFNKYARFTSDMLAFYSKTSGEYPVAYISDQKLYINDAEIKRSFQIGGYIDTVEDGGIVTRWVGGEG